MLNSQHGRCKNPEVPHGVEGCCPKGVQDAELKSGSPETQVSSPQVAGYRTKASRVSSVLASAAAPPSAPPLR